MLESLPTKTKEKNPVLVNYVQEDFEAKVIDEDGNVVPFGTPGELCVRGYANMVGYWEDEEKTNEMLGKDGWLKTGFVYLFPILL